MSFYTMMPIAIEKNTSELDKEIADFFKSSKIATGKRLSFNQFLEDKMLIILAIRKGIPSPFST